MDDALIEETFPSDCDAEEPLCQVCGDHGGAAAFVQCENVEHGCGPKLLQAVNV